MSNILNTALNFMGFLDIDEEEDLEIKSTHPPNNKKNISLLPKTPQPTVIHVTPETFEDVTVITKRLQDKMIVTINLGLVNETLCERIIDFLCGAVYGLDGGILKLADKVYLLTYQGVTLQERGSADLLWARK